MEAALFSPSSLFHDSNGEEGDQGMVDAVDAEEEGSSWHTFIERSHAFPGMELKVREFSFHQLNANLLWPGTFAFSDWLVQHQSLLTGRRILELGSGTGALAIFLRKSFGVDITTSDFDDEEVEENIAYNCRANGLPVLPHVRHSWGDVFPICQPNWDLVIASDILLYVKQYPNLIKTLCFLLKTFRSKARTPETEPSEVPSGGDAEWPTSPFFVMSWRRRIGKDDDLFFEGCRDSGLSVEHVGSRVYLISTRD